MTIRNEIPIEILKTLLYDIGDGTLCWARDVGQRARKDEIAGTIHTVKGEHRWTIQIMGIKFLRSRLVFALFNGRWPDPELVLDHKDKNTLNDAIYNLQEVTQEINMRTRQAP